MTALEPDQMRELIAARHPDVAEQLRASLDCLPRHARDAWVDAVLGVDAIEADEPKLPRGCTPYYPCSVDAILRALDLTGVGPADVFVDIGSGVGRVIVLAHLLTGARAIGVEVQSGLVERARSVCRSFGLAPVTTIEGDAAALVPSGNVFFLYCPFSGARLERVLDQLEPLAKTRPISVCCVHLPTIRRDWLERASPENDELVLYRSVPRS